MKINASYKTDIGYYRQNNQDAVLYLENKQGQVIGAICDGLGGHDGGEIASNMAINMLKFFFETTDFTVLKHDQQIHTWLQANINAIYNHMHDYSLINPQVMDMGTTMVITLITNNKIYFVNIGDSRIYQFNQQELIQLTKDHNLLNLYLQKKTANQTEIELNHTHWKVLTSALGPCKPLKTDIFHLPLLVPSLFLLTSDGVHDFLEEYEIINILSKSYSVSTKVKSLIKQALDNVSTDNVTALLLEIS